jgi:cell division protein FtsI (penicillin-binding protein 3)
MPRSADPPPPRAPRRGDGAPAAGADRTAGTDRTGRPRAGIGDARSYTPRGRTVREMSEQRRTPRAGRTADPFRPALQVLDGGRRGTGAPPAARTRTDTPPARTRTTAERATRTGKATGRTAKGGVPAQRPRATSTRAAPRPVRKPRPPARRTPRPADPRRRLRMATAMALTLFAVLGVRLVGLQVTDAPAYAAKGLQDRLDRVVLAAPRGAIYDRTGSVLAHSVEARYVYADPTRVEDPVKTAQRLSALLGTPPSELVPALIPHKRPDGRQSEFEWLARGVSIETAQRIMALNLAGINVHPDERREVPGHDLAANLIGFTGEDLTGLEGMEARYNDLLEGRNGELVYEVGLGKDLNTEIPGGYRREIPAQPGSSLRLTIDRDVQYYVQHVLFSRMRQVKASIGAAVVLDARTGEVVAQASYPAYDAADPLKSRPTDREDVATSVVVDPGSVHKAIVVGAALEEGVIKPNSAIMVGPVVHKGDKDFRDAARPNSTPRAMSVPAILAYSSNVGTIKIADMLGAQRLYDYQLRFGLGRPTGEGVPGEATGAVRSPQNWSGSSYGSIPIGHGVDATPLQMAAVYAAIANDGTWIQPHLVQAIVGPDGSVRTPPPPQTRQVPSPATAAAERTMLEAVVTVNGATGRSGAIQGYRVAGKTGTGARIIGGRYVSGDVASFIGMAPADNPRFVVAVFAHSPAGGGGVVAGPAFRDMMAYTLRHFKVPPTGTKPPRFVLYP